MERITVTDDMVRMATHVYNYLISSKKVDVDRAMKGTLQDVFNYIYIKQGIDAKLRAFHGESPLVDEPKADHIEDKLEKVSSKKRTLMQWVSDTNLGKAPNDKFIPSNEEDFRKISEYLQYLGVK